jgi:hypothetical protein
MEAAPRHLEQQPTSAKAVTPHNTHPESAEES